MSFHKLHLAVGVVAFAACVPAQAAVTIFTSPGPVQPDENVLFDVDQPIAMSVVGSTNQSNSLVRFTSNVNLDVNGSQGAARIESADTDFLDMLTVMLDDPNLSFTEFEFNLFNASRDTTQVTITLSNGDVQVFDVGNGQNYFGVRADGGDTLTSISFDSNGLGFTDVRQVRIGGLATAVPEPAVWAMLVLGFGVIGGSLRRKSAQRGLTRARLQMS